ncbi:MAG: N-acetyltransferase [Bacteroidetes bacterium]|nr:N-acetyltransferase [Bacteroidota bacterium]
MEIIIRHEGNRFITTVEGMESVLEYEMYGESTVVFSHTYVPIELRGRGLATEIIKEGLDWARQENLKVIPACSAVQRYIDRHPEYKLTTV